MAHFFISLRGSVFAPGFVTFSGPVSTSGSGTPWVSETSSNS